MFEHYSTDGIISTISIAEASKRMDEISEQWEDENTSFGKLYMGVFDWAYSSNANGTQLHIPNLQDGGSVPKNDAASLKFGFTVHGDCFLKL